MNCSRLRPCLGSPPVQLTVRRALVTWCIPDTGHNAPYADAICVTALRADSTREMRFRDRKQLTRQGLQQRFATCYDKLGRKATIVATSVYLSVPSAVVSGPRATGVSDFMIEGIRPPYALGVRTSSHHALTASAHCSIQEGVVLRARGYQPSS